MSLGKFIGNLSFLLLGGKDTDPELHVGGLWCLTGNPDEWTKLKAKLSLVDTLVREFVRYQTPVIHTRPRPRETPCWRSIKSAWVIRSLCGTLARTVMNRYWGPGLILYQLGDTM